MSLRDVHSDGPAMDKRRLSLQPRFGSQDDDGKAKERVLVRVYDLGQTAFTRSFFNQIAKSYGAFHTGVQVYGREWSFGMTFDDWTTGITWCIPGQNPDHSFRETLSMGYTTLSPQEVERVIYGMKDEWRGCTYNVLSRNCHNFSDELSRRLCGCGLPPWVNALASTGDDTVEFMDSADSGYDGGAAIVDFFSDVRSALSSLFQDDEPEDRLEEAPQRRMPRQLRRRRRSSTAGPGSGSLRPSSGNLSGGSAHADPFGVPIR